MNVLAYAERAQEVSTDLGLLQRDSDQWNRAAQELVDHLSVIFQGRTLQVEGGEVMQEYPRYVLREVREGRKGSQPVYCWMSALLVWLHWPISGSGQVFGAKQGKPTAYKAEKVLATTRGVRAPSNSAYSMILCALGSLVNETRWN